MYTYTSTRVFMVVYTFNMYGATVVYIIRYSGPVSLA